MSSRPLQYQYKYQPSTEAVSSIQPHPNFYRESPPKRYHQIQRTRQGQSTPTLPYPPIPTYPPSIDKELQYAERRNENIYENLSTSTVIPKQLGLSSDPSPKAKTLESKGI